MLEKKYKNIVYLIGLTIAVTILIQFYWNLKIYQVNKQQVHNQVQVSFDKAIEDYFNELAKEDVLTLFETDSTFIKDRRIIIKKFSPSNQSNWKLKEGTTIDHVQITNAFDSLIKRNDDTLKNTWKVGVGINPTFIKKLGEAQRYSLKNNEKIDSLKFRELTTKIMFSFQDKLIDLDKLDSLFSNDLNKKNIEILYGFRHNHKNPLTKDSKVEELNLNDFPEYFQLIRANSSFLPHGSNLQLLFTDTTVTILKRMLGSIILSFLLSGFIIGCLIFLLKIIFKQKQLSEIKNDFINNITHEFKTPISTISVALESLQNFDVTQDKIKQHQYLEMSHEQLGKLNEMVEKLLETATLQSDQFELNSTLVNLAELIKSIVKKYPTSKFKKTISIEVSDELNFQMDRFHFENALNNIIDNALKYGGDEIKIKAISSNNNIEITIEDNGNGIDEKHKHKIFDQFYRIPTGNIHTVKGFGIGLFYTRNIIEKHGGKIFVSEHKKGKVVFKIIVSNGIKN